MGIEHLARIKASHSSELAYTCLKLFTQAIERGLTRKIQGIFTNPRQFWSTEDNVLQQFLDIWQLSLRMTSPLDCFYFFFFLQKSISTLVTSTSSSSENISLLFPSSMLHEAHCSSQRSIFLLILPITLIWEALLDTEVSSAPVYLLGPHMCLIQDSVIWWMFGTYFIFWYYLVLSCCIALLTFLLGRFSFFFIFVSLALYL